MYGLLNSAISVTLSDLQTHPSSASHSMGFLVQMCSSWQEFNCHRASEGNWATTGELLVFKVFNLNLMTFFSNLPSNSHLRNGIWSKVDKSIDWCKQGNVHNFYISHPRNNNAKNNNSFQVPELSVCACGARTHSKTFEFRIKYREKQTFTSSSYPQQLLH